MNSYQIVQIKSTNEIGILEARSTWWERLIELEVKVIIPGQLNERNPFFNAPETFFFFQER
jgi:hypothetical protein